MFKDFMKKNIKYVISLAIVSDFIFLSWALVYVEIPEGNEPAFHIMLGILEAAFGAVVGYWIGSSSGSTEKTDILHSVVRKEGTNGNV